MNTKEKTQPIEEKILGGTRVEVHIPKVIDIILVQANEFRNYEMTTWIGSLFFSAMVGFWIAYTTINPKDLILFCVSVVFTFFTAVFIWVAVYYRKKLQGEKIKRVGLLDDFKQF